MFSRLAHRYASLEMKDLQELLSAGHRLASTTPRRPTAVFRGMSSLRFACVISSLGANVCFSIHRIPGVLRVHHLLQPCFATAAGPAQAVPRHGVRADAAMLVGRSGAAAHVWPDCTRALGRKAGRRRAVTSVRLADHPLTPVACPRSLHHPHHHHYPFLSSFIRQSAAGALCTFVILDFQEVFI